MPLLYSTPMAAKSAKKLFLFDAMGFVFRAFYAPMGRLNNAAGLPTKVPYLFSNMLRKLIREAQPDYIAVVFDPSGPTFRDKLFTKYLAPAAQERAFDLNRQLHAVDDIFKRVFG